jgi:hypothetical protein
MSATRMNADNKEVVISREKYNSLLYLKKENERLQNK